MKEYLEKRESEVVDIMMQLYDQEEVMRVHILNERRDSAIRATVEAFHIASFAVVWPCTKSVPILYQSCENA